MCWLPLPPALNATGTLCAKLRAGPCGGLHCCPHSIAPVLCAQSYGSCAGFHCYPLNRDRWLALLPALNRASLRTVSAGTLCAKLRVTCWLPLPPALNATGALCAKYRVAATPRSDCALNIATVHSTPRLHGALNAAPPRCTRRRRLHGALNAATGALCAKHRLLWALRLNGAQRRDRYFVRKAPASGC